MTFGPRYEQCFDNNGNVCAAGRRRKKIQLAEFYEDDAEERNWETSPRLPHAVAMTTMQPHCRGGKSCQIYPEVPLLSQAPQEARPPRCKSEIKRRAARKATRRTNGVEKDRNQEEPLLPGPVLGVPAAPTKGTLRGTLPNVERDARVEVELEKHSFLRPARTVIKQHQTQLRQMLDSTMRDVSKRKKKKRENSPW